MSLKEARRAKEAHKLMNPTRQNHMEVIAKRMRDPVPEVREVAIDAVSKYGVRAIKHAPQMALFVQDPNLGVRCAAARFIGRMGEKKTLPMPYALAVAKLLSDGFDDARDEAVDALAKLGAPAAAACGGLIIDGKIPDQIRRDRSFGGRCPAKVDRKSQFHASNPRSHHHHHHHHLNQAISKKIKF